MARRNRDIAGRASKEDHQPAAVAFEVQMHGTLIRKLRSAQHGGTRCLPLRLRISQYARTESAQCAELSSCDPLPLLVILSRPCCLPRV